MPEQMELPIMLEKKSKGRPKGSRSKPKPGVINIGIENDIKIRVIARSKKITYNRCIEEIFEKGIQSMIGRNNPLATAIKAI